MQPASPTTIPTPAAQAQAEPGRFFPPLAMSAVPAMPAAQVARHVAAIESTDVQRAALRFQIALGHHVSRAAARSVIDRAVEAGASGEAIVALIDAHTAAIAAEAEACNAERNRADARRRAFKERTQALRSAVSKRCTAAAQEIAVLTTRIRPAPLVRGPNSYDSLRAAGLSHEQLAALGRIDPQELHEAKCHEYRDRIAELRPVVAACRAFDADGDFAHLAGLSGFDELIARQRAIEVRPL